MSPEQTRGRTIDPRSDLFSLGTIIYVLVTGRPPFTGATCSEVGDAIRHAEPPPMARYANGVSDELERIVRKLHAKDPDDRYQSAHEVRTDIARLQEGWHRRRHVLRAVLLTLCAALVSVASWMAWRAWMPPTAVAVVPFVNQTGDPRLDYLGDGLAVNLNGTLIRGSHLSVAGASAVKGISLENRTPKYLAHELGVDAALTGSLNKHDGQLSLDLELLKCPKGFVIWAESYDYDVVASGDVERQIVRDVVYRLSGPFGGGKLPKPKPVVSSAYDRYLRARAALDDPDDAAPERALADLEQALAQDPDFALAWACRSLALWKIWNRDHTDASLRLAEEAADRAVQLNPELLEARLARAQVYRATSRYADAISELSDVLRVNPNWDEAELQLGATYREAGIISKAELHFWHATQVRPGFWRNWNSLGDLRFQQLGDYVGAREAYRKVIDLAPERNIGYTRLAALETAAGQYPAAIELYDRLPKPVEDGATLSNMGIAYLFTHRLEDSRRYFGRAVQVMPRDIDLWINLGDLHTRAGRPDSAQVCYENALQLADDQLHVDPRNRKLRVERIQCLAKVGHCDEVHAAFAARADTLPSGSADLTHRLAKAYALCGSRAEALAAARKAAEMGISPTLLRDEDEFAALKSQPAFPK